MPTNLNSPFVVFFLSRIIIITISPYGKLLIEHEDTRRFSNAKRNANFTRKHNSICEKCQNLVQSNTGHLFPCFSPGFVGLKKTSSLKENYRRIALWTGMWKRLFRQPLPLPLTKNEKTTVDLGSTNFAMDASYAFSPSLALLMLHVHSDL